MAKDKRVKGCPNTLCDRNKKKYKYTATDKYCTLCGTELTFVCPVCFRKLADIGPDHVLCVSCQAEREDRKVNAKKRLQYISDKVGGAARFAAKGVSEGAADAANAVAQTYGKVAEAVSEGSKDAREFLAEKLSREKGGIEFPLITPDYYSQLKKKPPKGADIPKDAVVIEASNEGTSALVVCFPVSPESSMPFADSEEVIKRLRNELGDNKGIIAVDSGVTNEGKEYVYNILKKKHENAKRIPVVVEYSLNMNIKAADAIWFLNGSFTELGTTGVRDSTMYAIYLNTASQEKLEMHPWTSDPYDPDYKKGFLMNLSEQEKLDEKFPFHPLSEARRFVKYLIENN